MAILDLHKWSFFPSKRHRIRLGTEILSPFIAVAKSNHRDALPQAVFSEKNLSRALIVAVSQALPRNRVQQRKTVAIRHKIGWYTFGNI